MAKKCAYADSHRRFGFADGKVLEFCTDEACDERLQRRRRAVLVPDAPKVRPDPRDRTMKELIVSERSPFAAVMQDLNGDEEDSVTEEPTEETEETELEYEHDRLDSISEESDDALDEAGEDLEEE